MIFNLHNLKCTVPNSTVNFVILHSSGVVTMRCLICHCHASHIDSSVKKRPQQRHDETLLYGVVQLQKGTKSKENKSLCRHAALHTEPGPRVPFSC